MFMADTEQKQPANSDAENVYIWQNPQAQNSTDKASKTRTALMIVGGFILFFALAALLAFI
jgi:uncharacterized protein involved in exopolysaccharide biosynthesis